MNKIYLIGSLRNDNIPQTANELEEKIGDIEIFSDWKAPGPEADDMWKDYCKARGWSYLEALRRPAATHIYEFDKHHLDSSDGVIMLLPAGKSCCLEFGYVIGSGKPGWILLDNPERWDVMFNFATGISDNLDDIVRMVNDYRDRGKMDREVPWFNSSDQRVV